MIIKIFMNTPHSVREIMKQTPHEVARLETRALARDTLASLKLVDAQANALAEARKHMDVILNADALQDPRNVMVERVMAVNKLSRALGTKRKVTGMSALGATVIENKGGGVMRIDVIGEGISYGFTVDSDGAIQGGPSTAEAADVGAGQMNPTLLVEVANTLRNLMVPN